jgi:hypothetical protein
MMDLNKESIENIGDCTFPVALISQICIIERFPDFFPK